MPKEREFVVVGQARVEIDKETASLLGRLFFAKESYFHKLVKEQSGGKARIVARHLGSGLDVAFVGSNGSDDRLEPMDLGREFGVANCVGFVLVEEGQELGELSLGKELFGGKETDYSVVGVTRKQLERMLANPSLVEKEPQNGGNGDNGAGSMWEQLEVASGVSMQSPVERAETIVSVLDASGWLMDRLGVDVSKVDVESVEGGGVALFFRAKGGANGDGNLALVPMLNVRSYKLKSYGGMVNRTKTNTSPHQEVVGIYVPPSSETLADSVGRVHRLLREKLSTRSVELATKLSYQRVRPWMAIANEIQMALWAEHGYIGNFESYRLGAVELGEIVELLSGQIGDVCSLRLHALSSTGTDVVFLKPRGEREYPEDLARFQILGKEQDKLEWVSNVVGIVCCEDGLPDAMRREIAKKLGNELRVMDSRNRGARIIGVDRRLLGLWREQIHRGEIIASRQTDEAVSADFEMERTRAGEGVGGEVAEVNLLIHESGPEKIGSTFTQIEVVMSDGTKQCFTLDMGLQFRDFDWQGIDRPSFELGMIPYEGDVLPFVPRFYRLSLMLKSLEHGGLGFVEGGRNNPWLRDLFWRLGEVDFKRALEKVGAGSRADKVMTEIAGEEGFEDIQQLGVFLSHFHIDHVGFGGVLGSSLLQFFSEESWPFAETMFLSGGGYLSEVSIRRRRETLLSDKKKERFSPPLALMKPWESRILNGGHVEVVCLPVDHSIYGSAMALVKIKDELGGDIVKILYTGDYRFGDSGLTEMTVEWLNKNGGVDVVITDTTNVSEGANSKPSIKVTREIILESLREEIGGHDGLVVVQLAANNLRDANLVYQAVESLGGKRQVVVGNKLGTTLQLYADLDEVLMGDPKAFAWSKYDRRLRLGSQVGVYRQPKATRQKGERYLFAQYPGQVMNAGDISRNGGEVVLVVPPLPFLKQALGHIVFPKDSVVIRSHYWPYGANDKRVVMLDKKFAEERGAVFVSDLEFAGRILPAKDPRFHESGHAKPEDFFGFMADLVAMGARTILPVHGEGNRQYVGHQLEERFPGVKAIKKVEKARDGGMARINLYKK